MEEMRDKHCNFQTMRRCLRTSHYCGGKNCNHRRRSQGNQGVFHQDTEVGLTNGQSIEQGTSFGGAIAQEARDARQRRLAFRIKPHAGRAHYRFYWQNHQIHSRYLTDWGPKRLFLDILLEQDTLCLDLSLLQD